MGFPVEKLEVIGYLSRDCDTRSKVTLDFSKAENSTTEAREWHLVVDIGVSSEQQLTQCC